MRGRSVSIALVECRASIDTHWLSTVTNALLEGTGIIVCGHVPLATLEVINVLTPLWRFRSWLASTETVFSRGHEVRPLVYLLELPEC